MISTLWWEEDLKKRRYEEEGAKDYRKAEKRVQNSKHPEESKRRLDRYSVQGDWCFLEQKQQQNAYQIVNALASENQGRSTFIQEKSGICLTKEILSRWTEYCSDLYNYEGCGDNIVLDCVQHAEENLRPILREEVEIAVAALIGGSVLFYSIIYKKYRSSGHHRWIRNNPFPPYPSWAAKVHFCPMFTVVFTSLFLFASFSFSFHFAL